MGHIGPHVTNDGAAFIHPTATLHGGAPGRGQFGLGKRRHPSGDARDRIGARTNIQDFMMIHVGYDTPTIIGEDCSITPRSTAVRSAIGCSSGSTPRSWMA